MHYLSLPEVPHALYVSTVQEQVREIQAVKERKAALVEALTNQVEQLNSEKDREQAQHTSEVEALTSTGLVWKLQVHQLQVCIWYALPKLT